MMFNLNHIIKTISVSIFILCPLLLLAQFEYIFKEPASPRSRLFNIGTTVMIEPIDDYNTSHKWISFDSTLAITSTKKLITPDAEYLVSQTYLEGINKLFRIDQFLLDKRLQISIFIFDDQGNLLKSKQIDTSADGKLLLPIPFTVSQSANKRTFSLVQALLDMEEKLTVLNIVLNEELDIRNKASFSIPFNSELTDYYAPFINDEEKVFLITAEKFNSYRIRTELNCYILKRGSNNFENIQFYFPKKKIKDLHFKISDEAFLFSGLYSEAIKKDDISGIINAGYNLKEQQYLITEENIFTDNLKKQIKKEFNNEGRKGKIINYLSLLPLPESVSNTSIKHGFAFMLPALDYKAYYNFNSKIPESPEGLGAIKQQTAYINTLVGTTPDGFLKPLDHAHAAAYAANNAGGIPNNDNAHKIKFKPDPKVTQDKRTHNPNILFLSFSDSDDEESNQFIKIKSLGNSDYSFVTYLHHNNNYSIIHYSKPAKGKLFFLNKTTVNDSGQVIQQKLFEHPSKTILPNFDFVINEENIITFFKDEKKGKMGLIKLKL